jgi:hypothetical protein
MAEDEGKPATVVGKDPKKRKMMAIGIGLAAALGIGLVILKGKSSTTANSSGAAATVDPAIANGTVPSDQQSSSDQLAQFATTIQAQNSQLQSGISSEFSDLASQLAGLGTTQPGAPPQTPVTSASGLVGQNELNYLHSAGQSSAYTAAVKAWNAMNAHFGMVMANEAHYSLRSDGSVTASPLNGTPNETVDINVKGKTGVITNGTKVNDHWPTVWAAVINPGVTNTATAATTTAIAPSTGG